MFLKVACIAAVLTLCALSACVTESKPPRLEFNVTGNSRLYPPFPYVGLWRARSRALTFQEPPRPAMRFREEGEEMEYHIVQIVRNQDGSQVFWLRPANGVGLQIERTFRFEDPVLIEILSDGGTRRWLPAGEASEESRE